jgi:hypothetical protein
MELEQKKRKTEPYYFDTQHENWREYSFPGIFIRNNKSYVLGSSIPELKYLHNLQNQFYFKTNEELVIDLEKLNV